MDTPQTLGNRRRDPGVGSTAAQIPLPRAVPLRIEKVHDEQTAPWIVGADAWYGLGNDAPRGLEPSDLGRVALDRGTPVGLDLEPREGAFDANGIGRAVDQPNVRRNTARKRDETDLLIPEQTKTTQRANDFTGNRIHGKARRASTNGETVIRRNAPVTPESGARESDVGALPLPAIETRVSAIAASARIGHGSGREYGTNTMTASQHFASDSRTARVRFLSACDSVGLHVVSYRRPQAKEGAPVLVDVARLGSPDSERLVVLCPGARLADALCASGIEVTLLREAITETAPRRVALLLVHATDPSALAAPKRSTTELPRNRRWQDTVLAAAETRFAEYARTRGLDTSAVGNGRASASPLAWPLETIADISDRFLARARKLVVLDLQTGSGAYGEGEVISCHAPGTSGERRAVAIFDARVALDTESATLAAGPIARGLALRRHTAETTAVVLQFGAYSIKSVVDSLLSDPETDPARVGPDIGRLFYPESDDWRERVWDRALEVIRRALHALDAS